jgi:DNA-directed RNA polymerase subunit RPC12/RpoP
MKVKTEIYCHECGNYIQFVLDKSLNGNHVVTCPNCGHEHCRVVKDGEVTGDRWDSRNGMTFQAPYVIWQPISIEIQYNTSANIADSTFLWGSWTTTTTVTMS